jgi:hypothetical protein
MGRSEGRNKKTNISQPRESKIAPPAPHQEKILEIVNELKTIDRVPPGSLPRIHPIKKDQKPLKLKKSGQVIGLCGSPQAGKDVIAEYIEANYEGVARANFSDYILIEVNSYLKAQGVDHEITLANKNEPLYRRLLQEWGGGRFKEDPNYWPRMVKIAVEKLAKDNQLVLVTGVRSPADFAVIEDQLEGDVWRAVRPGNSYVAEHEIEKLAATRPVDKEILNPSEGDLGPFGLNIEKTLDLYKD